MRGDFGNALSLPHARGGEPNWFRILPDMGIVFPTHVGVNRIAPPHCRITRASSPRTWG